MTATINNNTFSINMSDVLPSVLRLCDPEDLAYYNDMTPTTLDYLGDYRDGVQQMPHYIIASPDASTPVHRPIVMIPGTTLTLPGNNAYAGTAPQAFISYPDNSLGFDQD